MIATNSLRAVLLLLALLVSAPHLAWGQVTASGESLAARAKAAADAYQPVDDAALTAARNSASAAVNALWTYLGTQKSGPGWKSFLTLSAAKDQLARGKEGDLATLETAAARFHSRERGLEMPKFIAARDALSSYVAQLRQATDADAATAYKDHMLQLAAALSAFDADHKPEDLAKAGEPLAWLEERGLAADLTSEARSAYWKPNLLVTIDDDLVLAGFGRKVDETGPVSDIIVGARVRGTQHTTGDVVAVLVPNEHAAQIRNTFRATAQTQTVGTKRGANVWSRGTTKVAAVKNLFLTAAGFSTKPADANANTHTTPTGVNANRGWLNCIANGIVWNQVRSSQHQAEYESARKAEGRVERRLNNEAEKQLVDANERFRTRFRKRLEERNAFPNVLNFSTTETALNIVGLRAGQNELSALEPPPEVDGSPVMAARIHETMINNTARAMYAGRKLTREEYEQDLKETFGDKIPERLQPTEEEQELDPDTGKPVSWHMVFAMDNPIEVEFNEQEIELRISVTEYKSHEATFDYPMVVHVTYRWEQGDQGLELVRLGQEMGKRIDAIDVVPPGVHRGDETFKWAGVRLVGAGRLRARFERIFSRKIPIEPRELEGNWKSAGKLVLSDLKSGGKWLTASFMLEDSEPEMPVPVALRR